MTLAFAGTEDIEDELMYILAQKYMEINSGVVIKFDYTQIKTYRGTLALTYAANNFTYLNYRNYLNSLQKTYGGKGPDIIRFANTHDQMFENLKRFFDFADLNVLMDNDPDFYRENYFSGVFGACADKDKLNFVPLGFSFEYVAVNQKYSDLVSRYTDNSGTINMEQMFNVYEDALRIDKGLNLYMTDYKDYYKNFYLLGYAFDYNAAAAAIAASEKVEFNTEQKKSLAANLILLPTLPDDFIPTGESAFRSKAEILFATSRGIIGNPANALMNYSNSVYDTTLLLTGLNGKASFVFSDALSINEKCADKELAWDFIKFCLNTKPEYEEETSGGGDRVTKVKSYSYGINSYVLGTHTAYPLSKSLFKEDIAAKLEFQINENERNGYYLSENNETAVDKAVVKFIEMAAGANQMDYHQRYLIFASDDTFSSLADGSKTIDQYAEDIEKRFKEFY